MKPIYIPISLLLLSASLVSAQAPAKPAEPASKPAEPAKPGAKTYSERLAAAHDAFVALAPSPDKEIDKSALSDDEKKAYKSRGAALKDRTAALKAALDAKEKKAEEEIDGHIEDMWFHAELAVAAAEAGEEEKRKKARETPIGMVAEAQKTLDRITPIAIATGFMPDAKRRIDDITTHHEKLKAAALKWKDGDGEKARAEIAGAKDFDLHKSVDAVTLVRVIEGGQQANSVPPLVMGVGAAGAGSRSAAGTRVAREEKKEKSARIKLRDQRAAAQPK